MRALALAVALMFTSSGCIAVGAISGGIIGTLAPIAVAAGSSDPNAKAEPQTIIISGLVCAGIGALIGILAVEDNKPKKAQPDDDTADDTETDRRRGRPSPEGRDAEDQGAEAPEA